MLTDPPPRVSAVVAILSLSKGTWNSMSRTEPGWRFKPPPAVRVAILGEKPGATWPPDETVTSPETLPVPPSIPPLLTFTGPLPVDEPTTLLAKRVPPVIVVPPEYVLLLP